MAGWGPLAKGGRASDGTVGPDAAARRRKETRRVQGGNPQDPARLLPRSLVEKE